MSVSPTSISSSRTSSGLWGRITSRGPGSSGKCSRKEVELAPQSVEPWRSGQEFESTFVRRGPGGVVRALGAAHRGRVEGADSGFGRRAPPRYARQSHGRCADRRVRSRGKAWRLGRRFIAWSPLKIGCWCVANRRRLLVRIGEWARATRPVERLVVRAAGRRRSAPASRHPSCRRRSCRCRLAGCRADPCARRPSGVGHDGPHERVDSDPVERIDLADSDLRRPASRMRARKTSRSACETRSTLVTTAMSARLNIGPIFRGRFMPLDASSTTSRGLRPRRESSAGRGGRLRQEDTAPHPCAQRRASPSTITLQ